jgi:CBS domain-containing protein
MKVREIMTRSAVFCGAESTLEEACFLMRKNNCGFLPVVGDGGNVIGAITDRDICIALGTRNRKPSDVRVWDVMPHKLFTCMEGDDVHCALKTLREARIRRLPVIDRDGSLAGVLSIDDIVLKAREHFLRKDVS